MRTGAWFVTALLVGLAACGSTPPAASGPPLAAQRPDDLPGLKNVVAFAPNVWSGSSPDGPAAFRTLRALGVRTIISVDGGVPAVADAEAQGLRYIHLPLGYDGVTRSRRLELSRAIRDARANGPVYIHCHHGKHRSAAAAGVACVTLGWATPDEMVARMKVAGTAASYTGLYRAVEEATLADPAAVDAIDGAFPSVSPPSGFLESMVDAETMMDHLRLIERAGWRAVPTHPDLVPAAEAGRLHELLRASGPTPAVADRSPSFRAMWEASVVAAQSLERGLVDGEPAVTLSSRLARLAQSCVECHREHRDRAATSSGGIAPSRTLPESRSVAGRWRSPAVILPRP